MVAPYSGEGLILASLSVENYWSTATRRGVDLGCSNFEIVQDGGFAFSWYNRPCGAKTFLAASSLTSLGIKR